NDHTHRDGECSSYWGRVGALRMTSQRRLCALTGANGYVGRIVRRGLESAGWSVVGLSRIGAGDTIPWSLEAGSGAGNAPMKDLLREIGISALVHAAWDLRLTRPKDLERVNVQGSIRLFAESKAAGVSRLVFISTISSYEGARSDY